MIIEFDESIFNAQSREEDVRIAIESVCAAVRRGFHFLFSKRIVLDHLYTFPGITQESKVVIEGVRSTYATTAGFLSKFGYRIIIRDNITACNKVDEGKWELPLSSVVEHGVGPLNLLGENSKDAELYAEAAKHYAINNGMGSIKIYGIPRNGNGAGTSQELRRYIEQKREWVICVTDSDKNCPEDALGDVAQLCASEIRRETWVAMHIHVAGRTIENVLPHNLVVDAVPVELRDCASEVARLHGAYGDDVVSHANLKDGIPVKWIRGLRDGSPNRKFWQAVAAAEGVEYTECCRQRGVCNRENACRKYVVNGFGGFLTDHVRKHLNEVTPHKAAERARSSFNFELWHSVGRVVCQMAMAPKPTRS